MFQKKYTEVYNGKLDKKKALTIEINGGNLVLSDGEPYLVAKSRREDGVELKKTADALSIYGKDCELEISYPKDAALNIKANGSNLKLQGMSPKDYLKMNLNGANANLNSIDLSEANTDMKIYGTNTNGSILLRGKAKSELNVDINGGIFDVRLDLPKSLGISTSLEGQAVGNIAIPESREGKNGNLRLRVRCNGGVVKIKE